MRKMTIDLARVKAGAELWDDRAPKTVAALLENFPITNRTIHVRWSGAAWRTEKNYPLSIGSATVDKLLDQGNSIYDRAARKTIYAQIEQQMVDDAPYVWLFYPPEDAPMRAKLRVDPGLRAAVPGRLAGQVTVHVSTVSQN